MIVDSSTAKRIQEWLDGPYDEATKREIRRLSNDNPQALIDAFYKELSFGTGGMRGVMGVGTNRMNVYTVRRATQGLANYLLKLCGENRAVFIGYDVRHFSPLFANEAARVLSANGVSVYLTQTICPTPLVSFGCRHFRCQAAIMITASHNPPIYNGYKVYWSDGGQIVSPHDQGITDEIAQIQGAVAVDSADSLLIQRVGSELDEAYLARLKTLQLHPDLEGRALKIIYTPLHGTGIRIVPQALASWGYTSLSLVEKQATPDADFTFAPIPNPEEEKALAMGEVLVEQEGGDLLIATDPDADRVGVAIRGNIRLTGNQIACILAHHIASSLYLRGELPENGAFVKTIVTTELFKTIVESFNSRCIDVLTGFKFIGEKINLWEQSFGGYQFLFGAEESYGYLFGTFVRDKDAISTSCLIAEAAALAKRQNLTLLDRLYQLYQTYGIHRESLTNLQFDEGALGMEKMNALMRRLRSHPLRKIGDSCVALFEDYLVENDHKLPRSDVLRFWLEDGSKLVIRPSGTEPKVKIYAEVAQKSQGELEAEIRLLDEKLRKLVAAFLRETSV